MFSILNSLADPWLQAMSRAIWQGTLAIVIIYTVCRVCPRIPAAVRCWLWRAVAIRMLLLLITPVVVEIPVLSPAPSSPANHSAVFEPSVQTPSANGSPVSDTAPANTAAAFENELAAATWNSGSVLLLLWIVSMFAIIVLVSRSAILVRRLQHQASALTDPLIMQMSWNCAETFRLPHIPRVVESKAIHSPAVTGLFRPTILIPCGVRTGVSKKQIQSIIAHEMAHISRRDLVWNWLDVIFATAFWAHPLVWVALRELRLTRETACDELAVRHCSSSSQEYANTLLTVIRDDASPDRPLVFTAGVVETASTLKRRILEMRYFKNRSVTQTRLYACLMPVLALPVIVPWQPVASAVNAEPVAVASEPEPQPVTRSEPVALPDKQNKDSKYQNYREAWAVGVAFFNSRNFESAREPLEAALALAPDKETKLKTYEALVPCYRLLSKTEKMTEAAEYILTNSNRDAQKSILRRSYLSFLYQRGKIKDAVQRYEKQLKKNPKDFVALYLLSEIYANIQRNPKRATEVLEQLSKVAPVKANDPTAILKQAGLARQYIQAKNYKKGAELYEQLAPQDEKLAGYYLKEAAIARAKMGEKEKAVATARKAVKAGPDPRNDQLAYFWHRQLGDFFLANKLPKEALPLLEKAVTLTKIEGYLKDTQAKLAEARTAVGK